MADIVSGAYMYAAMDAMVKSGSIGKEYERRFKLDKLPVGIGKGTEIHQGMLIEGKNGYARIRKQGDNYTMTAKYFPKAHEAEMEISKEIFDALWPKVFKKQVKRRYKLRTKDNNDWTIDEFEDGRIIAEVETPRANSKVKIPEKLDVAAEIRPKIAKDSLPGGLADDKKPTDFPAAALAKGTKHELEHTKNEALAREIAMDHLAEDVRYYDLLEKLEKQSKDDVPM